jgi:hypothetical protein
MKKLEVENLLRLSLVDIHMECGQKSKHIDPAVLNLASTIITFVM